MVPEAFTWETIYKSPIEAINARAYHQDIFEAFETLFKRVIVIKHNYHYETATTTNTRLED